MDENDLLNTENDAEAFTEDTGADGSVSEPAADAAEKSEAPSFWAEQRRAEQHKYSPIPPEPVKKAKTKKGLTAGGIVALALCCSLLGGVLGTAGTFAYFSGKQPEKAVEAAAMTPVPTEAPLILATAAPAVRNDDTELSVADVYEAAVNSTVGITTSITTNYWGYQSTSAASGSGFILTSDGYVLTNYHVIEDSNTVTVSTYDGQSYDAEVVGYDISNDIAVLKIDAQGLQAVTLGSSDSLRVGDTVLAIGNPLGELTFSLTKGVVSALDREITMSNGTTMALIQTDTAINSGNSGGALFDMNGTVVGITNAKYSGRTSSSQATIDNIGFAIPIDSVRYIVESIISNGYIVKPYIGVSVTPVSSELISYGMPAGAAVKVVNDDSPAKAAGLKVNDIITAVNGTEITSSSELVKIVSASVPGDELTLTVYRHGSESLQLTVTVGEHRQDAKEEPERQEQSSQYSYPYSFPFGFNFGYGNG